MGVSLAVHVLAAIVWVGGMFFAYVVLRPSVGSLAAAERLRLWEGVFSRFFPWVMAAIAAFILSGYTMIVVGLGGFAGAGLHVHIMQLTGWLMFALFFHLFFVPWRRFRHALAADDLPGAGRQLGQIRRIVAINLTLGLLTAVVATSGRYW